MSVESVLSSLGWSVSHCLNQPPRERETFLISQLRIGDYSAAFLAKAAPEGIYRHQAEAIKRALTGENVCMTTGTASGKSLAFQVAALEAMAGDKERRVLAIYPLKALGREQRNRWESALQAAGLNGQVGVIDGSVPMQERLELLRHSQIIVATPDILHAWMLSRLGESNVRAFLQRIKLVIVDEVHNYAGVFGTNSSFLFRRLAHAMTLLGNQPRYFCASATLEDASSHLFNLFGRTFSLVDAGLDTSPRQKLSLWLVERKGDQDLLTELSSFLLALAADRSKFLAFVDSRKLTEHITSIAARSHDGPDIDEDDDDEGELHFDHLKTLDILPYRSGYEEKDRAQIQRRLARGSLAGVVSTSALELGIDIPFLDAGVLVGVPHSSTSLVQRIGRIGRHADGDVVILNTGTIYDEAIFNAPDSLLERPAAESALYLENERIQYIHVLCLARLGGEHDQLCQALRLPDEKFSSEVQWPDGFLDLCESERVGEVSVELFAMKAEAGESPHYTFPLRDVESQFKVQIKSGPDIQPLGSLSYSQVMREAYPGAVYYYTTKPFRVTKVGIPSREIQVRRERRYTTRPQMLPTLVFPNLTREGMTSAKSFGECLLVECSLQVRESISGFKERRGPNEFNSPYPLDHARTGVYFPQPRFARNFFTTGTLITHPAFEVDGVSSQQIAELIYESFLIAIPFERQDINYACDKFRADRGAVKEGTRFVVIYDQTYGSLHLSARLLDDVVFRQTISGASSLAETTPRILLSDSSLSALKRLAESSESPATSAIVVEDSPASPSAHVRVIKPGSRGLDILRDNEEFEVQAVFFNPSIPGLAYRGRLASTSSGAVTDILPVANVVPIPGESELAFYDENTGELHDCPEGA